LPRHEQPSNIRTPAPTHRRKTRVEIGVDPHRHGIRVGFQQTSVRVPGPIGPAGRERAFNFIRMEPFVMMDEAVAVGTSTHVTGNKAEII